MKGPISLGQSKYNTVTTMRNSLACLTASNLEIIIKQAPHWDIEQFMSVSQLIASKYKRIYQDRDYLHNIRVMKCEGNKMSAP